MGTPPSEHGSIARWKDPDELCGAPRISQYARRTDAIRRGSRHKQRQRPDVGSIAPLYPGHMDRDHPERKRLVLRRSIHLDGSASRWNVADCIWRRLSQYAGVQDLRDGRCTGQMAHGLRVDSVPLSTPRLPDSLAIVKMQQEAAGAASCYREPLDMVLYLTIWRMDRHRDYIRQLLVQ
jgi:hypothetical protein